MKPRHQDAESKLGLHPSLRASHGWHMECAARQQSSHCFHVCNHSPHVFEL